MDINLRKRALMENGDLYDDVLLALTDIVPNSETRMSTKNEVAALRAIFPSNILCYIF